MSKPYKVILTKKYSCVFEIEAINDIDALTQIHNIMDNKLKDSDYKFSGYELDYIDKDRIDFEDEEVKMPNKVFSFFKKWNIKKFKRSDIK